MTEVNGRISFTQPATMIFCKSLIVPEKFKDGRGKEKGEPTYAASFMFEPNSPDLNALKEKMLAVSAALFPSWDIPAKIKAREFVIPLSTGEKMIEKRTANLKEKGKEYKGDSDFMKGKLILKSKSIYPPALAVLVDKKPLDLPRENEGLVALHKAKFYMGVQALAQVNFVAYKGVGEDGKPGVTAYLDQVLSLNRGEKIGGVTSASETFSGVVGQFVDEDPTGGKTVDDEIPF